MGARDILFIFSGAEGYGVRRGTLALANALRQEGFETHFAALTRGPVHDELVHAGHRVEVLTPYGLARPTGNIAEHLAKLAMQGAQSCGIAHALWGVFRQIRPELAYFRLANLVAPVGIAARLTGTRAFWHMPNAIGNRYPFQLNKLLYWSILDRCPVTPVANSSFTAGTLNRGSDDIPVLHVGTDEGLFDPLRIEHPVSREELGLPDDAIVFGIVAKLASRKGQTLFLESLASLPVERTRQVFLLLLGGPLDRPYAAEIHEAANRLGWQHRVKLIGPVSDPERYYGKVIDVAVNARIDAEPYGQSVVEAMMMETPVLVHALGGPAQTVLDGVTGWHVRSPSHADFAHGIQRVLNDKDRWGDFGRSARKRALEVYSLNAQTKQFLKLCGLARHDL